MEHVRITAPDLKRRAALETTRSRLLVTAAGFALLFGAVVAKLASATIIFPMHPKLPAVLAHVPDPDVIASEDMDGPAPGSTPIPRR